MPSCHCSWANSEEGQTYRTWPNCLQINVPSEISQFSWHTRSQLSVSSACTSNKKFSLSILKDAEIIWLRNSSSRVCLVSATQCLEGLEETVYTSALWIFGRGWGEWTTLKFWRKVICFCNSPLWFSHSPDLNLKTMRVLQIVCGGAHQVGIFSTFDA